MNNKPLLNQNSSIQEKGLKHAIQEKGAKHAIYYYGQRWPSIHQARIRTCYSKLNQHLFNNHLW